MKTTARIPLRERDRASALVVVLWAVAILAVVVISMAHASKLELRVVKNQGDAEQARWLALAGVEKAKALIYRQTRGTGAGENYAERSLWDNAAEFREVQLGRGFFSVLRQGEYDENRSGIVFGIVDEERRLNVNHVGAESLARLERVDEAMAAAIVDWRDDDSKVTPNGAEQDYYSSLVDPYRIRNDSFQSIGELTMVRDLTPRDLWGEDMDGDGFLDAVENDGEASPPFDDADGYLDRGLAQYLAVDSGAPNINRRGEARVNIKVATAADLARVPGISDDLAQSIVAYRDKKNFGSIVDLLAVRRVRTQPAPPNGGNPPNGGESRDGGRSGRPRSGGVTAPSGVVEDSARLRDVSVSTVVSPGSDRGGTRSTGERSGNRGNPGNPGSPGRGNPGNSGDAFEGEPLISMAMLKEMADDITATEDLVIAGAVNINTASEEVIACIDGLNRELAVAIVSHRESIGGFSNVAELLDVPGVTTEILKGLAARVTTRGGTYRIVAEGVVPSTGARRRVEAVVRIGDFDVETLYWREGS